MPEFQKKLKRAAVRVQGWKTLLALLLSLVTVVAILVGLTLMDRANPMQERTSLALMGGVLVFGVIFLIGQFVMVVLRRPGDSPMAQKVEEDHPELMDLFNCAVDLMKRKAPAEMNKMEQRVVREAGIKTASFKMEQSLLPKPIFRQLALMGIAGCCGLLAYSQVLTPVRKALNSLDDLRAGKVSGLTVLPGTGDFPRGSDVAVQVHIHRGTHQAWVEYISKDGSTVKEAMRLEGNEDSMVLDILKAEPIKEGAGTVLFTELSHGLATGHSVELSGTGWADGVHRVTDATETSFSIGEVLPVGTRVTGKLKPLPAPVFYFYGIDEPQSYRVVTPELTSDWYELSSFIPPSIDNVRWKVTPPAYTQLPVFDQEGFKALKLPEGSLLEMAMDVAPTEVTAYLVRGENRLEIGENDDSFSRAWIPSEDAEYALEVETQEKRRFRTPLVPLEILPDNPPIVEIRKPAKDVQLHVEDSLRIEAFAVDDYGIAEARMMVRLPQGTQSRDMPVKPVQKEKEFFGSVNIANLNLKPGDIFSYFVEVGDNKRPEAQWTRSGVYFVEIIPPEQKPQDGDEGPTPKEIPLRNVINENKQLIRETYIGMGLEGKDREEQNLKVTTKAHSLKNDLNRLYSENKDKLRGPLGNMVQEAIASIEASEKAAAKGQLEESLTASENSLRTLVRMSAMLRKPPTKSKKPSKPKEGEGEGEQAKPEDQQGEKQPPNLAEQFKEMQKDLDEARSILDDQKNLNSGISRNARTNRTGKPNKDLAGKQGEISSKTRSLRDRVYDRTGKLAHAQPFDQAEGEMKAAKSQLEGDQPGGAEPHGIRAAESLENSVKALESGLRQLATQMLQGLENEGNKLAGQQKSLKDSTEGASAGEGDMLKKSQQGINKGAQDLLSTMEQAARALEKVSPKATEALFKATAEARKGGIDKSGKRAENALNYEIFPKASREQEKVERELGKTSENLADIKRKLANEDNQVLKELLQSLNQTQRGLPGMSAEETKQSRQDIASQVDGLEETARNVMLQTLVQQLKHGNYSDEPSVNRSATSQILAETQKVLQSFLWQEAVQDQLQRNREATAPPRKYKGQVQEYFRRLAEGSQ
ncbi:MAG: DUF4175 family protein [Opitutae bacterium]|nr:DUF4175 family protein [Opitutae bacterium]